MLLLIWIESRFDALQQFRVSQIEMRQRHEHRRPSALVQINRALGRALALGPAKARLDVNVFAKIGLVQCHRNAVIFGFLAVGDSQRPTNARLEGDKSWA